ncbi:50S ribosomal protein L11 methyltransferase [Kordiimonas sp. SCSIO 12610]|uniref:50S ribosomal protein L11 methyltransferase n=1 Tax=Kordiimonas sp. SCSIO 12610 TaxID=2829597 RepID=UPI002109F9D7|nr:50S ribosomal protein L11 methyltransferase [Kordiimonas sp. SCSIO 12610]UTW54441.1 50S ribosomal protein L11 methyltransferase [Kordiimonas sp. SCSIO 12610]
MTVDTWCLTLEAPLEKAQALETILETSILMESEYPPTLSYFEQPGDANWKIELFVTGTPDENMLKALLRDAALKSVPYSLEKLEDRDWVSESQKLLKPVEAGRFYIYGSHDADSLPQDTINILIDAGQAFGTGQHETTWACLHTLDTIADTVKPKTILDLGTGTGVLAIAAKNLWPDSDILATDIDPIAIDVTVQNMDVNDVKISDKFGDKGIRCVTAEGLGHSSFTEYGPFDLITANILAGPLIDLAPALTAILRPGGTLILSGLLLTQEKEVLDAYRHQGPDNTLNWEMGRVEKGEWLALKLIKPLV